MNRNHLPLLFRQSVVALLVGAAVAIPLSVFFSDVVSGTDILICRDAGHYYPALYDTVRSQWGELGVPVWNPHEERGRPLLADPTASVWYPGKFVFWLPLHIETRLAVYVAGHLAICFATLCFVARKWGCRFLIAAVGAVSYTFGGSILFQHANPPYLVSAAWLPLGVYAAYRIVADPHPTAQLCLGLVLSMMVLGGDPETAYLLGLATLALAFLAVRSTTRRLDKLSMSNRAYVTMRVLLRVLLPGALAVGLTAAQWFPTLCWAQKSERMVFASNSNDVSTEQELTVNKAAHASLASHESKRYRFSIGPWRWAELIWPNFSGRPFPQHSRWITILPAERRFWSPTLYMGLLPFLLACGAFRFRGGRLTQRWLTVILVFSVAASLGRYGLGWLIREATGSADLSLSDETGGLYWMMVQTLPGFALFRYPAKLWTWAALSISLLAAVQLEDRISMRRCPLPMRVLGWYLLVTALSLLVLLVGGTRLAGWLNSWKVSDALFGPLQSQLVVEDMIWTTLHAIAVASVIALCQHYARTKRDQATVCMAACLLVVTVADVTVAHRWLVPTAPQQVATTDPLAKLTPGQRVYRYRNQGWYPESWAHSSRPSRYIQATIWDRQTARPKYPLLDGVDSVHSETSFSSRDQRALLRVLATAHDEDPVVFTTLLRRLGVDWYVGPGGILPFNQGVTPNHPSLVQGSQPQMRTTSKRGVPRRLTATYQLIPHRFPRVWISHRAKRMDQLTSESRSGAALQHRLLQAMRRDQDDATFRETVVIECEPTVFEKAQRQQRANGDSTGEVSPDVILRNRAQLATDRGARKTIQVNVTKPCWLVVNQNYDSGWQAERIVGGRRAALPVLRANRVMCAMPLAAGSYRVAMRYVAPGLREGMALSGLTGVIVLSWMIGVGWKLGRLNTIIHRWVKLVDIVGTHL